MTARLNGKEAGATAARATASSTMLPPPNHALDKQAPVPWRIECQNLQQKIETITMARIIVSLHQKIKLDIELNNTDLNILSY